MDNYASTDIFHYQEKDGTMADLALVSPQLLLFGDDASVHAAIDHYLAGDASQASNPLYLRASELAATNDIWVVAHASPSDFSKDGLEQAQFLKDVDTIEAGVSLQSGLGLELNLGTNSPQSATELASGLQMMLGMMLAAQSNEKGGPNLADRLQVATDDTLVRLALHLDDSEVEQTLGQMASSMMSSGEGADGGVPGSAGDGSWSQSQSSRTSRPEPPSAHPGTVMIYGLDGGPREIPLGNR